MAEIIFGVFKTFQELKYSKDNVSAHESIRMDLDQSCHLPVPRMPGRRPTVHGKVVGIMSDPCKPSKQFCEMAELAFPQAFWMS